MKSWELVDRWLFNKNGLSEFTTLRIEAKHIIFEKVRENILDLNNPDEFKFSEELILKRHTGQNVISTHFSGIPLEYCKDCRLLYLKGNIICVQDINSGEIFELNNLLLNFFGAIRILEYIEQGKYIK